MVDDLQKEKPSIELPFWVIMDHFQGVIPQLPKGCWWRLETNRQVLIAVQEGALIK